MELYQIKTFAVVAEEGNLTRSAERLHASQSAISLHIKALEEEFSIRLFKRSAKGMALTPEGKILLEKAVAVLDAAKELKLAAKGLSGEVRGLARVGLHTSPIYLRTPALIKAINKKYPGLALSLNQSSTWDIRKDIAAGELESGFFYSINQPEEISAFMLEQPHLKIVGPSAWQDKIENASWEDLAEMPWIWTPPECSFHHHLTREFSSRNLEIRKAMVADSEDAHATLVRSETGLTLMRADEADAEETKGGICTCKSQGLILGLYFGYKHGMSSDPVVRALIECVRSVWEVDS